MEPSQSIAPDTPTTVEPNHALSQETPPSTPLRASHLRRFRFLYLGILLLLLLVFVPPLVNVGRFQRRIATSIGNSLGRPVHLDSVSLTLLPLPGFTITNLVVGEDPAFGFEPIIRANSVRATLRLSSLWRRQVEFSTISFSEPSVNLAHAANGQWNIESILLRASRIETAPTAQRRAGPTPRFPYIEATGARLNIKQEQEKLPFSLVDADFALWLPDPHQWHLRLRARPNRTDTNVSDTGTIELEATLGAAPSLNQVPLNMQGQWRDAQLGEASRVLLGHDAGWRGQMNISANIRGTFGESAITTQLRLIGARPADFVPEQPISTEVECFATATGLFHAFEDLRCSWPPATSPQTPAIALTGTIPDVHRIRESSLQIGTPGIPGSTLVSWLRAISQHVPESLAVKGTLTGSLSYGIADQKSKRNQADAIAYPWHGELTLANAALSVGSNTRNAPAPLISGDVHLQSADLLPAPRHRRASTPINAPNRGFVLAPTPLLLGGHDPAVLTGHLDDSGYSMHLTGNATAPRLAALAQALPPLGDGLLAAVPPNHPANTPFHIDLIATRSWGGQQVWQDNSAREGQPAPSVRRRHVHR